MTRDDAPRPGDAPESAIGRLLVSHGARIHALARRLCGNRSDAEDLVQDVFMQAFRRWPTYRGEGDPAAWLYAIARRAALRRIGRRRRADRVPSFSQLLPWTETSVSALVADPRAGSAQVEAQRREAIDALQSAIARLPEHFRLPLVLKEVTEMSLADTARLLGLKEDTVKTRLHRARLLLRQVLEGAAPRAQAPPPIYEKQVCLDLLKAKLEAMDAGRDASLGRTQGEMCDRCRAVFAELDLVQDACAGLADGDVPAALRARILRAIAGQGGGGAAFRSGRGRPPVTPGAAAVDRRPPARAPRRA